MRIPHHALGIVSAIALQGTAPAQAIHADGNSHEHSTAENAMSTQHSLKNSVGTCLPASSQQYSQVDEETAFQLCKVAAENKDTDAQYELGLMYLEGRGCEDDENLALHWLWQASIAGHAAAAQVIKYMFSDDFGIGC